MFRVEKEIEKLKQRVAELEAWREKRSSFRECAACEGTGFDGVGWETGPCQYCGGFGKTVSE